MGRGHESSSILWCQVAVMPGGQQCSVSVLMSELSSLTAVHREHHVILICVSLKHEWQWRRHSWPISSSWYKVHQAVANTCLAVLEAGSPVFQGECDSFRQSTKSTVRVTPILSLKDLTVLHLHSVHYHSTDQGTFMGKMKIRELEVFSILKMMNPVDLFSVVLYLCWKSMDSNLSWGTPPVNSHRKEKSLPAYLPGHHKVETPSSLPS